MLWIALHIPELPLQALVRGMPEPLALMAVVGPRNRLLAVTPAANALGVQAQASVSEALAIAPGLHLHQQNSGLERDTLHALAHVAARYTPSISLAHTGDVVLLEVSGSLRLFDGLTPLLHALLADTHAAGLTVRHSVAPTPLAAHWLALCAPQPMLVLPSDHWPSVLDSLPVQALLVDSSVSASITDLLSELGIRTLGNIATLPRDGLARRQAQAVLDTLARARGHTPDPRNWLTFSPEFSSRLSMPVPMHGVEPLMFASERLITEFSNWLKAQQAACAECLLGLEHESHASSPQPATVLQIVPASPIQDKQRWLGITRERLAALKLPAAVTALTLTARHPIALSPKTPDLFGGTEADDQAAQQLLEKLRARLGADSVYSLQPRSDHRPEHAWQCAEPGHPALPRHSAQPARRPVWLLREPQQINPPDPRSIESGPERIETGWWDSTEARRDYYIIRNRNACRLWVFHKHTEDQQWYVHGYFG